jgi:hypothetical protein
VEKARSLMKKTTETALAFPRIISKALIATFWDIKEGSFNYS